MNTLKRSHIRAAKANAVTRVGSIGYESMALSIGNSADIREEEEYYRLLDVCTGCCPDGICEDCGCIYSGKLILQSFKCRRNKFNEQA